MYEFVEDDTLECKEGLGLRLFPVTYSLLSKQAVGLHIQHNYEIGSVVKIQYFLRGMNDTYEVETDVDKYIFRIYKAGRRSGSDIEFELELLRFLSAKGDHRFRADSGKRRSIP